MSVLSDYTENFGVSRPIFKLELQSDGRSISLNRHDPLHKFEPTIIEGDFLSELVASCYKEYFYISEGCYTISRHDIANSAMREIRGSIPKFLEKNLEMRSPTQSKIYRWAYRNMPTTDEFNDVLVMLYKYMRSFCDSDMKANNIEHMKNTLALLEAIMEKNNEQ